MTKETSILLAIEDTTLKNMIEQDMKNQKYVVKSAANGNQAVKEASLTTPDVVILDYSLKDLTGVEVCAILRSKPSTSKTPIIMLTNNAAKLESIKGQDGGFDDYLVHPVAPNELINRVRGIMRSLNPEISSRILEFEDIRMDLDNHRVTRGDKVIHLGNIEFKILQVLLEYPKEVLSREKIISRVWGYKKDVDKRTVDVHINRIRSMLKNNSDYIPLIKTVRSSGYCLRGAIIR